MVQLVTYSAQVLNVIWEFISMRNIKIEIEIYVFNPLLSPVTEGGWIHFNFVTVPLTPLNLGTTK